MTFIIFKTVNLELYYTKFTNLVFMKIALVNDTFLYGRGADTVIYELAKRLGRKHDVYVLAGETNIKEENFKFIKINLPKSAILVGAFPISGFSTIILKLFVFLS